jgi:hypothetical protein
MLLKSRISKIQILSDEWFTSRLAKFTSSEIHFLCNDRFLTDGCVTYIHRKAGEALTGKSVKSEIDTDSMRWGAQHEAAAVRKFAKIKGLSYVVCQQLITEPNGRFGSTPDGIIVLSESKDELEYEVNTIEVKCPPTYHSYIGLALCETPQDLKAENRQYYWQVLDQMDNCDCMRAFFAVYHPDFKKGGMRIIDFRRMQPEGYEGKNLVKFPLVKDLQFLRDRKNMAVEEMDKIIAKISSITYS